MANTSSASNVWQFYSNLSDKIPDSDSERAVDPALQTFLAAVSWVSVYYTMFLIVVGCVCNPLSILVFSRPAFRDTTTSVYLRLLSVMDLAAILCGLTRHFQRSALDFDVRHGVVSCKINLWLVLIFVYSSCWTLVAVTAERVISIMWPHRVKAWCSKVTAVLIGALIILASAAVNSPVFPLYGHLEVFNPDTNDTMTRTCVVTQDREYTLKLWFWADAINFAFVPCTLLIIFNFFIIRGVIKSRQRVQKVSVKRKKVSTINTSTTSAETTSSKDDESTVGPQSKTGANKAMSKRETSITITLLAINITFIVCNFPVCAYQVGPHYQSKQGIGPHGDGIATLLLILMFTNNALNFLLYCITGSRFRREVKLVIKELVTCAWFRR
ncbi:uncharacterized protein LOC101850752 [Aplysia californica]|uniref:Uncharacterized protein LOC101850752 n=1 Tax=Aplysia californica TaxID=6500 RepID=A0ABM0K4D1_APLCA|nr:uncharacterized protein LOC101850752 [Aplysia californica]